MIALHCPCTRNVQLQVIVVAKAEMLGLLPIQHRATLHLSSSAMAGQTVCNCQHASSKCLSCSSVEADIAGQSAGPFSRGLDFHPSHKVNLYTGGRDEELNGLDHWLPCSPALLQTAKCAEHLFLAHSQLYGTLNCCNCFHETCDQYQDWQRACNPLSPLLAVTSDNVAQKHEQLDLRCDVH